MKRFTMWFFTITGLIFLLLMNDREAAVYSFTIAAIFHAEINIINAINESKP